MKKQKIFNLKLINGYMKKNRLSKLQFSKICNIDISVLNKILADKTNIRSNAVFKVARAMNEPVYKLFY